MDEFKLLKRLLSKRKVWNKENIEVDIGDDAGIIIPHKDKSLVVTCDTMVETVHFLRKTMSCEEIGWKCLASNISDIAAMGGLPRFALLSVAIPVDWTEEEMERIYQGFYQLAQIHEITLIGGDTVKTPGYLTLSLTLLGEVEGGKGLLRSSAKPGDILFVTSTLGDSAAGLDLLYHRPELKHHFSHLVKAHTMPTPQVEIGRKLAALKTRPACNDISDGLASEAWEIAEASHVKIVIDQDSIPLSTSLQNYARMIKADPYSWALYGGEDYQLVGTIEADAWKKLQSSCELIPIGSVEMGEPSVELITGDGRVVLEKAGYNHFRS